MTITAFSAPPQTSDPSNFDARADTLLGTELPRFVTEANALAATVNASEVAAVDAAADAVEASTAASTSAAQALAAANYKGLWSSLSGALAIPASVYHANTFWQLTASLANVALAEPGVSSSWVGFDTNAGMPAVRPSLAFDFENNPRPDSRLTVSGGAGYTVMNRSGRIAASSAPRFDFDYSTGQPLGLKVTPPATNLCAYSQEIDNAYWSKTNLSVTANAATAPDGTATADLLIENSANATHAITRTLTISADVGFNISVFVASYAGPSARFLRLNVTDSSTALSGIRAIFDTITGSFTGTPGSFGSATLANSRVTPAFGGWRVSIGGQISGGVTSVTVGMFLQSQGTAYIATYLGDGASGMYLWGLQLTSGTSELLDYIPTTTAAVAATGDNLAVTGAPITAALNTTGYLGVLEGSLLLKITPRALPPTGATRAIATLSDGTSSNRVAVFQSPTQIIISIVVGGVFTDSLAISITSIDAPLIIGLSFRQDRVYLTVNGATPSEDLAVTMPAGLNRLDLGAFATASYCNMHFGFVRLYRTAFTAPELMALARVFAGQARLLGNGPNQAPTNGGLQSLAYQSADAPRVGQITYESARVVEVANGNAGVAALVAGSVTVSTTAVTANSRIRLDGQNSSGTAGALTVSARTAGVSFTITSTSGSDTRQVAWEIREPA